jgi:meiotic recombination protein SPO11
LSYDAEHLAIPNIKWIGVHQADFAKYNVPIECRIPLTEEDKKKGVDILNRACIKARPKWE